jgi:hypothetical protein
VHANLLDLVDKITMRHQLLLEGHHRFMVAPRRDEQQTFDLQIMPNGDKIVSLLDAGLVNAVAVTRKNS